MSELSVSALLADLLAVPSPSGEEAAMARLVRDYLDDLQFETSIDAQGNAIGVSGDARGPTVMLLGHLDTVGRHLPVRRSAGRIYGRGAVDAKGPLSAMMAASTRVPRDLGQVVVIGAVQEEVPSSAGARHLLATRSAPDAIVIGEPSGWTGIGTSYRGHTSLTIEAHCPPTHSSTPEPKAVEVVAQIWHDLRQHLAVRHPGTSTRTSATTTLTSLHGNMEIATATISCRVPAGFDGTAFDDLIETLRAKARIEVHEAIPHVARDRRDPVVASLVAAIRDKGERPTLKFKGGSSDMNVVAEQWPHVPMAAYGPGDSKLDHTDHEFVEESELELAVETLTDAIIRLLIAARR